MVKTVLIKSLKLITGNKKNRTVLNCEKFQEEMPEEVYLL